MSRYVKSAAAQFRFVCYGPLGVMFGLAIGAILANLTA